jgi:hypothetical protein
MIEPASPQDLFKGRHFDPEIIVLCVRWYLTLQSGRFRWVRCEAKPVGFGNVPAWLNLPHRPLRFGNANTKLLEDRVHYCAKPARRSIACQPRGPSVARSNQLKTSAIITGSVANSI